MAEEELKYTSDYSGEATDAILEFADKIRQQAEAEDGDTVQVYDTDGNPHKVSKTELMKKSVLALPSLSDISAFVAINQAGDAVGIMSKEQVATVLGGLLSISGLQKAFQYKRFSLKNGETATVGKVSGLMVIRHPWSDSKLTVVLVNNYNKEITQVAGREYGQIPLEITWEGSGYNTVMKITSTYNETSGATVFYFTWQEVYG